MDNFEELLQAHQHLVGLSRNMRADINATGLLLDALLTSLPTETRATVAAQFELLSERYVASLLATSTDPQDDSLKAMTAALDRMELRLGAVQQL